MQTSNTIPLYFDHFYRVVHEKAFEELKSIVSLFPNAEHRRSNTNYGVWEGVYLYTSSGAYIEFMLTDSFWKTGFLAMCTSQYGDEKGLHQQLTDAHPEHQFSLSEINRPNGDPWMFCTMLERPNENLYFYAEEYREKERQKRKDKGKTSDNWLTTVTHLECIATSAQFENLAEKASWFSRCTKADKNSVELALPQINGDPFQFTVRLNEETGDRFLFKVEGIYNLEMFGRSRRSFPPLKHFRFEMSHGKYWIEYLG